MSAEQCSIYVDLEAYEEVHWNDDVKDLDVNYYVHYDV